MASVVFLKGVNVGGHRTFRPSLLASEMASFGVVNVGAAGTFVVRKTISEAKLRLELSRRLPFETEAMICSGRDVLQLVTSEAYAGEPSGPDIVRFVSVLPRRLAGTTLPLDLPADENWLVRIVTIQGKFAFGLYRRSLQTIRYLGKLEKHLGGSVTTRNWNTFERLFEILRMPSHRIQPTGSPNRMSRRFKVTGRRRSGQ